MGNETYYGDGLSAKKVQFHLFENSIQMVSAQGQRSSLPAVEASVN